MRLTRCYAIRYYDCTSVSCGGSKASPHGTDYKDAQELSEPPLEIVFRRSSRRPNQTPNANRAAPRGEEDDGVEDEPELDPSIARRLDGKILCRVGPRCMLLTEPEPQVNGWSRSEVEGFLNFTIVYFTLHWNPRQIDVHEVSTTRSDVLEARRWTGRQGKRG